MKWGLISKSNVKKSISVGKEVHEYLSKNGDVLVEKKFAEFTKTKGYSQE